MFWLFFAPSLLLTYNWIIGCCPSLGDIDGKDLVCQYFSSLFYDKKTATGKQRKFCKYTGLQRVVGGWNDGQNDDSLVLSLSLCVSVIDPQFFVVLFFCQTNILSLCIVETSCLPKPSASNPRLVCNRNEN